MVHPQMIRWMLYEKKKNSGVSVRHQLLRNHRQTLLKLFKVGMTHRLLS